MPSLTIRHVTTYRYRQPGAFGEHWNLPGAEAEATTYRRRRGLRGSKESRDWRSQRHQCDFTGLSLRSLTSIAAESMPWWAIPCETLQIPCSSR
jgi:hypothetical protein